MIEVTTTVHGADKVTRSLSLAEAKISDVGSVFEKIEASFYAIESARFDAQPWTPLAESTLARKAKLGLDTRILRERGWLRNSLIHAGAQYGVRRISGDILELGTSRPGATAHQDSRRSWLPIRKIIDIGPAEMAEWKKLSLEHAVEAVKGLA